MKTMIVRIGLVLAALAQVACASESFNTVPSRFVWHEDPRVQARESMHSYYADSAQAKFADEHLKRVPTKEWDKKASDENVISTVKRNSDGSYLIESR